MTVTEALTISLTPTGHLVLSVERADDRVAARIAKAWAESPAAGLLHLGWVETETPLPVGLGFWREVARSVVAEVCTTADIEVLRERVTLSAPTAALEAAVRDAPPMLGGEYLDVALLERLREEIVEAFRAVLRASPKQTVQQLLVSRNPAWHVVGRVHFHLAENKRDEARPFAFMASYTTGLSAQGKPQHRALGEAVRESATAQDKGRLLTLLAPVQQAATRGPFLKELIDSGQIFRPLSWSPQEAFRFLREIPALEDSGVVVRVPDWWKARRPPRPTVSVSVGGAQPSGLGLTAMLDFSVSVTLEGETLTPAELQALRAGGDGLALLKGKWVEIDRQKLEQVLTHWRGVQKRVGQGGLSFAEGMRLLAGTSLGSGDASGEHQLVAHEWSGVKAGAWLAQTLSELRRPGADALELGAAFRAELRPYQREGVKWLRLLTELRLGACLADDMGLGKTVQVLALLTLLERGKRGDTNPHLLVVPASLIANWKLEAERFAPSLRAVVAHPSEVPAKALLAAEPASVRDAQLVITSYGTLHRVPWMTSRRWGVVVLDEAQAIKNPSSLQTRAVKTLESSSRIALTGTPVENRLGDLWSLFDFLNPGLLGTAKEFTAFVKSERGFGPLRELTRPYLLRRMKTDRAVIADLPEKTEVKAWCTLSKKQAALYEQSVEGLAREISQVDGVKRRGLVLAYLMRFKQICNHPSQWLDDGEYAPELSGKHERLAELCEVIASRQEKVLVFSQFREMTVPLAKWLERIFGRPGLVLSGQTAVKERQKLVKSFQEDERVPFFVLSLKAGGTGLNLTAASHVIHFDRWWNPAVENQATDRAFRIGQRRNVLVHKFVCRGTIEERVDALIESKQSLAREVLSGGGELKLTELDDQQLMNLVALDLNAARAGES